LELSRALLIDHLGDAPQADTFAIAFMREVVANFANEWEMTSGDIDRALKLICARQGVGSGG
jgi:hypothetical protein